MYNDSNDMKPVDLTEYLIADCWVGWEDLGSNTYSPEKNPICLKSIVCV